MSSKFNELYEELVELEREPSKNYCMNFNKEEIKNYCDELEAMKQVIFKILSTERYKQIMYSWNYGIETDDLFGESITYVCAEVKRRISEALMQDDRVKSVEDFVFDTKKKGGVSVNFMVSTIFGEIYANKEVNY